MDPGRTLRPRPVGPGVRRSRCSRGPVPGVLALLLVSAAPLSAQVAVGFKAGQTSSTVAASRLSPLEQVALAGYAVGIHANIGLSRYFGVSLGLAATRKGTRYALPGWAIHPGFTHEGTLSYRRKYLEVSVLARAGLPLWDRRVSFYAVAGPALDVSIGCAVEFFAKTGPNTSHMTTRYDCRLPDPRGVIELAEGYDLGAISGIGGDIATPWGMRLSAEYLYTFGLKSDGLNGEDFQNRTRTIQFGLSYTLR